MATAPDWFLCSEPDPNGPRIRIKSNDGHVLWSWAGEINFAGSDLEFLVDKKFVEEATFASRDDIARFQPTKLGRAAGLALAILHPLPSLHRN